MEFEVAVEQAVHGQGNDRLGVVQMVGRLVGRLQEQHARHVVDRVVEEHGMPGVEPELMAVRGAAG